MSARSQKSINRFDEKRVRTPTHRSCSGVPGTGFELRIFGSLVVIFIRLLLSAGRRDEETLIFFSTVMRPFDECSFFFQIFPSD